jgi:hypothetical protein
MKLLAGLVQKPPITIEPVGEENVQPGADKEFKL